MLLTDRAHRFGLRPLRYQFPVPGGDSWDDNWLVVAADLATPSGRWSFTDACLLVDEARTMSGWLRAMADGRVPDALPGPEGRRTPDLGFIEPVLAFSQVRWRDGAGVLRVHLSPEGAPPWQRHEEEADPGPYLVEIETNRTELVRAAEEWDRELAPFPLR
ncbi:hypothetical protein [Streptomyces sp. NPDC018031]|uniref:WapI family immunity protein n=1 Tax=Streptomyces sp. NPDC018031 TaxID=3365033 RepID=UPI00378FF8F4